MFERYLTRFIKSGKLAIARPDGTLLRLGDWANSPSEPEIVLRLKDRFVAPKIALHPDLYFGEAYMDGALALERGDLRQLLELCGRNLTATPPSIGSKFAGLLRKILAYFLERNSVAGARRNVAHHYDLREMLFRSFLDEDMQYSCAYFRESTQSLEQAQIAKKDHIIAKLLLKPGQRVLDIGCGWGGLAMSIAQREAVQMTAITLSQQQLSVARSRARENGLDHRIAFNLEDYRDLKGTFDRVVSVGMFEHVGRPNYQRFFERIAALLNDDGVAVIHSIGRADGPGVTYAWTRKYIFPGGYIPALSEVIPFIEKAGLLVTDIEILRLHYAETLREWRERFMANIDVIREAYDERFCRMWDFYLAGSEMAFRYNGLMVFQLQLAKRVDSVPITRDYMFEAERAIMGLDLPPLEQKLASSSKH